MTTEEQKEKAHIKLIVAASMALGYVCAKEGEDDPLVRMLAESLEANGMRTTYSQAIINRSAPLSEAEINDPSHDGPF